MSAPLTRATTGSSACARASGTVIASAATSTAAQAPAAAGRAKIDDRFMEGSLGPGKCPRDRRRTLAQSAFFGNDRVGRALNNDVRTHLFSAKTRRFRPI